MNAISTLCATTTVGAAALGYAFGVPHNSVDSKSPKSTTSKTNKSWKSLRRWSSSRSQGSLMSLPTSTPHLSGKEFDSEPRHGIGARGTPRGGLAMDLENMQSQEQSGKQETNFTNNIINSSSPPHEIPEPLVMPRRRTRPASWAVSHSSSSRFSPNPQLASESIPEGFVSKPGLAPDKLNRSSNMVQHKRSASGNLLGLKQTWKSFDPLPQRAVTLHIPPGLETEPADEPNPKNANPKPYRNYFTITLEQESNSPIHHRTRQPDNVHKVRRIRPSGRQQPTLTLADCVAAPTTTDELFSPGLGAIDLESSNNSPASFGSPQFSTPDFDDQQIESGSRHSFSISDILSRSLSFKRNSDISQLPRRRLQRPLSQRITSAPQFRGQENSISISRESKAHDLGKHFLGGSENRRAISGPEIRNFINHQTESQTSIVAMQSDTVQPLTLHSPLFTECRTSFEELQSPELSSSFEPIHSGSQRSQRSTTLSELSSSHLGSDISGRVFSCCGEEEIDLRSDTIYDSMRTDTNFERSTFPGSLFENESPVEASRGRISSFDGFFHGKSNLSIRDHNHVINEEEEEEFPTPIGGADRMLGNQVSPVHKATLESDSSPPMLMMMETLTLQNLSQVSAVENDPFTWSDDEESNMHSNSKACAERGSPPLEQDEGLRHSSPTVASADPTMLRQCPGIEFELKTNVFDWSEQPVIERVSSNGLPRPKTMHGKNGRNTRGSRSNARRTHSGPHARSQSVPALSDQSEDRVGGTSKFGTWGIGSKGATEDWDDDFDFSGPQATSTLETGTGQHGATATNSVFIPQAIREQQTNVLANIGLLKEWGILIEELKELRLRAAMVGVNVQLYQSTLDEVDAMIDLADQEADESIDQNPIPSPSSIPELSHEEQELTVPEPTISDRTSQLLMESTTRPRTNSEAIARSVIQAIQQRRISGPKTPQQSPVKAKAKVPFDKGTLKHILPHLVNLVKTMKRILRNAEGFSVSPEQKSKQRAIPAFSKAFVVPADDSPTKAAGHHGLRLDFGLVEEDWDLS